MAFDFDYEMKGMDSAIWLSDFSELSVTKKRLAVQWTKHPTTFDEAKLALPILLDTFLLYFIKMVSYSFQLHRIYSCCVVVGWCHLVS